MQINCSHITVLAFDLDDTLYKEIEFVRSGFAAIVAATAPRDAHEAELSRMLQERANNTNPIESLFSRYPGKVAISEMVSIYREHFPSLQISKTIHSFILTARSQGARIAIVTDGRSITQRNKIKSLGLEALVDVTVVSEEVGTEKPAKKNYRIVEAAFGDGEYFYFGDNPRKDFVTPNELGWTTVGLLDDGRNIHSQEVNLPREYQPSRWLKDWSQLSVASAQFEKGSIK